MAAWRSSRLTESRRYTVPVGNRKIAPPWSNAPSDKSNIETRKSLPSSAVVKIGHTLESALATLWRVAFQAPTVPVVASGNPMRSR